MYEATFKPDTAELLKEAEEARALASQFTDDVLIADLLAYARALEAGIGVSLDDGSDATICMRWPLAIR